MNKASYCQTCHDLGKDDDCETCDYRMPEIAPLNMKAYTVWSRSYTQWRYGSIGGMGGAAPVPMGLDYNAVFAVARMLDIELSPGDFIKIQKLERFELNRMREMVKDGGN